MDSRFPTSIYGYSEHHGEVDGYCPSPVVACVALAVAAPNCRIGQGVALAPLYGW